MITAPFNFVPLSDRVFFPNWSKQVNHDIPFSDGESGVIEITITAKSPIFIRDHKNPKEFCNYKGEYYIPATSLKGMVRDVLEIMSFSKMSFIDDNTYAVRDLRNKELYMSKMKPDNIFCGWLKKTNSGYIIEDCGKPARISHSEIDKIFNIDFASKFKDKNFSNRAEDKTAKRKYELIGENRDFKHNFTYVKKDANREIYRYDRNGDKKGTLVLTGQPSARKEPKDQKPSGKVYEFIFFEPKDELIVSDRVFKNFLFAYFDERKTEPKESPDWSFWKKRLKKGEKVPIFFQKNGKEVLHFGLSYLYKLPYKYSIKDGLPPAHKDKKLDLAQTIFGYIDDENNALKGRVQFSHFRAVNNIEVLQERVDTLGTPRASYYPIYIEQEEGKLYKTYMDSDFKIAGWKRYPIHKGVKRTEDTKNENVKTTFRPLASGVVFKGKLYYHNLKKAELGAVLSALSFHNTPNTYHNIGMAKPLGYGKIEVKITNIEIEEYLKAFETEMTLSIPNWIESEQITQLLSMATEQENRGNSELKYMNLKEFAKNKTNNRKDYLRRSTKLNNIKTIKAKSYISKKDLEKQKEQETFYLELQKINRELDKKEDINLQIIENFIKKYSNYEIINKIVEKKEFLEKIKKENKYQEINKKFNKAYSEILKKKGNSKLFNKEKEKFIKKWSQKKNNKGSEYILNFIENIKNSKNL